MSSEVETSLTISVVNARAKQNSYRFLHSGRNDKIDSKMTNAADKIIVALDVPTKKEALELVDELRKKIRFFKIGLQLFTAAGPKVVSDVLETGAKVFLDL